jgi:hypothetical protein
MNNQKRTLLITVTAAMIFAVYFLRSYFIIIAFAALLAFLYNPSYKWFLGKTKQNSGASITLTMLFAIATILLPLSVLLFITAHQATSFVESIKNNTSGIHGHQTLINLITSFNSTIHHIPGLENTSVSIDSITSWSRSYVANMTKTGLNYMLSLAGGFTVIFSQFIIFIFVFISLLKNQRQIIKITKQLNPLGDRAANLYLSRISAMTKAMVKGQFIIAFLQGLVDSTLLYLAGVPYFFFWLVFITFLSVIPLGGGIIVLPVGFVFLMSGHIWEGQLLILGHIIIVTNIDNVLRPQLVPKAARLDPALTILSVFAGLKMFGFLGIVLGPVIMIILITTIQEYLDYNTKQKELIATR